jgi:CHASE3 domain sensor protein
MGIGKKLYIMFGSALLCTLVLGTAALTAMSAMTRTMYELSHEAQLKKTLVDRMSLDLAEQLSSYRGMLARG